MNTPSKVQVVETDDFLIITAAEGWTEEQWEAAISDELSLDGEWDYVVEVEEDGSTTDVWILSKATA